MPQRELQNGDSRPPDEINSNTAQAQAQEHQSYVEVQPVPWRGYEKLRLLRDLALGEFSMRELSRKYSVPFIDIENFKEDYQDEISELKQAFQGLQSVDTAGLWIAKKSNRIAEYQAEAEDIRATLESLRENNVHWSRAHRDMLRTYLELLHAVADELGAYPQRAQAPAKDERAVHYVIETQSIEDLK